MTRERGGLYLKKKIEEENSNFDSKEIIYEAAVARIHAKKGFFSLSTYPHSM